MESIEDLHVLCGDFKVKNIGILEDAFTVGRFGNRHQSVLQRPTDKDLRRRFRFRMGEQAVHQRQSSPGSVRCGPLWHISSRSPQVFGSFSRAPLVKGL